MLPTLACLGAYLFLALMTAGCLVSIGRGLHGGTRTVDDNAGDVLVGCVVLVLIGCTLWALQR